MKYKCNGKIYVSSIYFSKLLFFICYTWFIRLFMWLDLHRKLTLFHRAGMSRCPNIHMSCAETAAQGCLKPIFECILHRTIQIHLSSMLHINILLLTRLTRMLIKSKYQCQGFKISKIFNWVTDKREILTILQN